MKTIVANGPQTLSGRRFAHGEEIPATELSDELLDYWLDHKLAIEIESDDRRSLHRLFSPFSGTDETETLDRELAQYAL